MTNIETSETVTEQWLCLGRRNGTKGKLLHAWVKWGGSLAETTTDVNEDAVMFFGKLKGEPGRLYDVAVTRSGDGGTSARVVNLTETLDPEERAEFEAQDRIASTRLEIIRAEDRDAKDSALTDMVAPLRVLYRKKITPAQRAAFLAVVTELITR